MTTTGPRCPRCGASIAFHLWDTRPGAEAVARCMAVELRRMTGGTISDKLKALPDQNCTWRGKVHRRDDGKIMVSG